MLTAHSQLRAQRALPSSVDKPETEALPPISPQEQSAPAGSSSSPSDPADKEDPRRAREAKSE
jgi:hypothetical protein